MPKPNPPSPDDKFTFGLCPVGNPSGVFLLGCPGGGRNGCDKKPLVPIEQLGFLAEHEGLSILVFGVISPTFHG